jgi:hypothetical protein
MSFQCPFCFRLSACGRLACTFFFFIYIYIYFPVLLPSFGYVYDFHVIFHVLFYFLVLLACNRLFPFSLEFCCLWIFNFGLDLFVVDVIVILAFESRKKSFGMKVFSFSGLRNNSYPCIWLSLFGTDLVLNMKFSHELAD